MKILFILLVSFLALQCRAEGTRGGGDTYSIQFASIAAKISDYFHQSPVKGIDVDQLDQAIKSTAVESTDQTLTLNRIPKDAINYPDQKRIVFNRQRWTVMQLEDRPALVLHEYLGILKLENATYEYSKSALNNFRLTPLIRGHDSEWLLCSDTDLVVNIYNYRAAAARHDTDFTVIHGGQILIGTLKGKDEDGAVQAGAINLKQADSSYATFIGQVSIDWPDQTFTIDGTIMLVVDPQHTETIPVKKFLHCEEKGDLLQK